MAALPDKTYRVMHEDSIAVTDFREKFDNKNGGLELLMDVISAKRKPKDLREFVYEWNYKKQIDSLRGECDYLLSALGYKIESLNLFYDSFDKKFYFAGSDKTGLEDEGLLYKGSVVCYRRDPEEIDEDFIGPRTKSQSTCSYFFDVCSLGITSLAVLSPYVVDIGSNSYPKLLLYSGNAKDQIELRNEALDEIIDLFKESNPMQDMNSRLFPREELIESPHFVNDVADAKFDIVSSGMLGGIGYGVASAITFLDLIPYIFASEFTFGVAGAFAIAGGFMNIEKKIDWGKISDYFKPKQETVSVLEPKKSVIQYSSQNMQAFVDACTPFQQRLEFFIQNM